jgi:hypothetical protein
LAHEYTRALGAARIDQAKIPRWARRNRMDKITDLKAMEPPLLERVQCLAYGLEAFLRESKLSGVIGCGVWSSERDISGGLAYTPHSDPEEESIDVDFEVVLKEEVKEAKVDILLMWSYGPLIKPYIEDEIIPYSSLDQLSTQLCQLFDSLRESLLEDMKSEMRIERDRVYRDV